MNARGSRQRATHIYLNSCVTKPAQSRFIKRALEGHLYPVNAVAFSPDGQVIWAPTATVSILKRLDKAQHIGAQAITGAFSTVSLLISKAVAALMPTMHRLHWQQLSTWIKWHTKPPLHRFWKVKGTVDLANKAWISPLQKMAEKSKDINLGSLEKINAYAKAPWNPPANVFIPEKEITIANAIQRGDHPVALTDGSIRNNLAGIGVHWTGSVQAWGSTSTTISTPDHINLMHMQENSPQ